MEKQLFFEDLQDCFALLARVDKLGDFLYNTNTKYSKEKTDGYNDT
ncbi:hypothetical protein STRDD11_02553 [Streptococcus sp. DD11]|nr:hypothetical protein STRDD11_02553 [Streptococcus sp. DD11]